MKPDNKKISPKALISVYLIIPLCIAVYLVDRYFFASALKDTLPRAPEHYFLLSILFGTPHILASNIIVFSNKEYWHTYKRRLFAASVAIGLFFGLGNFIFSYNTFFFIIASWTITHVVKQQLGLGNAFYRLPKTHFFIWNNSIILLGVIIYNMIFLEHAITPSTLAMLHRTLLGMSCFIFLLTAYLHFQVKSNFGKLFLWANTLMILSSYLIFKDRFFFLAVLIPRVIHDVSAFIFYCVHDHNRHKNDPKNFIYATAQKLKMHAFLVVPIVAVGLTLAFKKLLDPAANYLAREIFNTSLPMSLNFILVGFLSLMHYYTEAFTWKNGSPYKKHISFS